MADKALKIPPYVDPKIVGKSLPRVDAAEKVTGRAIYPTDVRLPNMAHVRFVRSPRAHARVVALDIFPARSVPGVLAVVLPEEIAGKSLKDPLGRLLPILTAEPKYFGEEILAVCAETEDAARAAARQIRIDYEDLPHALDAEEQVLAGQCVGGGWTKTGAGLPAVYERGDGRKAFAKAYRVFERTYKTSPTVHCSIEPHGAVASYENGQWTIWESTQGVFAVREDLAEILGEPIGGIRVIGTHLGGGFGSKVAAGKYTFMAAYLSKKLGRPVRCVHDRAEEFLSPYGRPPSIQTLKIGVRADGKIAAIAQKGVHAVGAYEFGSEWGHAEDMVTEMYACENVRTESYAALTNTPPPCAMRAPGYAQAAFALEQMIDEIAHVMGMDPVEFRIKNIPVRDPDSGRAYATPRGVHGLAECLKKGAEIFKWTQRKNEKRMQTAAPPPTDPNQTSVDPAPRVKTGIGVAATCWSGGGGPPAASTIRLHEDGTADLFAGAADIGTGTRTVLAQIAAEEMGIRVEDIRVTNADTHLTSYARPSYGSFTLPSSGPAVRAAANAIRRQLLALAAGVLQTAEKNIVLTEGRAVRPASKKTPEESVSVGKLVGLSPSREILGHGERERNPDLAIKSYGVQFAAVAVDVETGKIALSALVAVNDSGRVINHLTYESQQMGGATMGLGMALIEERVYDRTSGKPLNPNLSDYKVPTILDQPAEFQASRVEVPFDGNSIGAKGLGEPPTIPTAAAVANAVFDAIGIRMDCLPLTPKRVLDALYPQKAETK